MIVKYIRGMIMQEFIGVYWDEQGIYCFVKISAETYESALNKLSKYLNKLKKEGLFFAIGREVNNMEEVEII
jgi:hypothetical protein